MRKIRFIAAVVAIAVVALAGCRGGSQGKKPADKPGNPADNRFAMPEVPAMITDNQEALDYIVTHYWDKFLSEDRPGVQDTSLVRGFSRDAFGEIFFRYAMFLRATTPANGLAACRATLNKVEKIQLDNPEGTLWSKFTEMYGLALMDPNSPYRNEEYCIPLLEKQASSTLSSDSERERAERDLPRFCLNRLGAKATDFAFTLRTGKVMKLYDIDSDFTIIFFSNPGCPNCREVMEALQNFPGIDNLIANGLLSVANVYPDEDLGEWIKYSAIYPKNWYNGYDHLQVLHGVPLYNLRAIPSVYLLDKEKRVMLKDAPTDLLMETLEGLFRTTNQGL